MLYAQIYYYLKAVIGGISSGILYLSSFLGADFSFADLTHVSVGHWLGTVVAVFGIGGLVGAVSNGPKPVKATPVANASE
jgi:hypothetical protein